MKRNQARLLKLALVLGVLLLFLLIKNQLSNIFPPKPSQPFSSLKKDQIQRILITKDATPTAIFNKNNHWYTKIAGEDFLADEERINSLIDNIISLKKEDVVSTNKNKHKDLGIDKQKIELKTKDKNYFIFIGNSTGSSKNYVRIDNENDVFTASGFDNVFTPDDYRDLAVKLITDENKISGIEIAYDDKITKLEKKSSDWKIGLKTAKKDRVDFFLNDLKTLKANDILPKDTILAQVVSLTITVKESGKEKKITFYTNSNENYLAKTSVSDFIFQIPTAYVESLKKEEKDFTE